MKQTLLLSFYTLVFSSLLSGQIVLESSDYFPVIGDSLKTIVDNSPEGIEITASGGDQTWSFLNLGTSFDIVRVAADPAEGSAGDSYPGADVVVTQVGGGEGYYVSGENSFSIVGFAGEDPLGQGLSVNAPFDPPYVERWAPLNFFDINNNSASLQVAIATDDVPGDIFDNLPISPDSIRVSVNSQRTDLVDGWGTLSIPGGTYDVLREKRTEYRSVSLEAKIGPFPWADITDIALDLVMIDELGEDTIVTYSFWSNEAKEPIAIITMNDAGTGATSVEYKDNGVISNTETVLPEAPKVRVYPNPAMIDARFEFSNLPQGNYSLEIYNLAGKVIWRKEYQVNDHLLAKVNVTAFPKGIYLYTVSDENGRRLTANRLIVTKP